MAEKKKEAKPEAKAEGAEGEAKGGGLKKIILLVVVALVLVGASVGATLFFLGGSKPAEEHKEEHAKGPEKPAKAIYVPIRPALVINFSSQGRRHLLQVDLTVMTRDTDVVKAMEEHAPMIKNHLSMLIGAEVYEDLQTEEGRELMRQRILTKLQEIMQQEIGKPAIDQVLFESFVMQ